VFARYDIPYSAHRENVAMIRFARTAAIPLIRGHSTAARLAAPRLAAARLAAVALAVLALAGCQTGSGDEQTLVDRAALTVQEIVTQKVSDNPRTMLGRAKGVMICPRVFKAGFFFGGEGGSCVLLARSGNGTWSYPTFYDIASGSFGFQFGVQDSQLILLIMTNRGLNAVMDSQVRLGANVSVAVASVGAGVQGATTAAVGADILAFAEARGLFGGVSLDGGVMSARTDMNQSYYGQPLAPRQIVLQMQGSNPGADPLREVLTRYGGGQAPAGPPGGTYQPPPPPYYQPPPGNQPPPGGYQPSPGPQAYPPAYQQQPAPAPYQPQPAYQPPQMQPSYQPPGQGVAPPPQPTYPPPTGAAQGYSPPPPSGYQPPPGQYTYPPPSGSGPIQEQSLPPPGR
jgi:lipid-binding SYLF domain-containing protein